MLNIPEYTQYGGETQVALMDNSALEFMHQLKRKGYCPDQLLGDYDLILIPCWVAEEVEDAAYRKEYVEELYSGGLPIYRIDERKYGNFTNNEDINLYHIVEAAVSCVASMMSYLNKQIKTPDLLDLPDSTEWMQRIYDEWPDLGEILPNGRYRKKNAGEISLTILAEIFSFYCVGIERITMYTQDSDAFAFQTKAVERLEKKQIFAHKGISVTFKTNDAILYQMYCNHQLRLDEIKQLRPNARMVTYTYEQEDKSVVYCKKTLESEDFVNLISDKAVHIIF